MISAADVLPPSRLLPRDVFAVGSSGLRSRRLRAALSALGVAIGIASLVAVLGISASSQADLLNTIDRLGTNLLSVEAGQSLFGDDTKIPKTAEVKITSMTGVQNAAATYAVSGETVRRNALVDEKSTSGISVQATDRDLPSTFSATMSSGRFLTASDARYPTVVLGSVAASRLGIANLQGAPQVYIGGQYYTVVGILDDVTLDSSVDRAALIGLPVAERLYGTETNPSKLYLRADDSYVTSVRDLVAATANPEHPEEVEVSRPSDALAAKAAAKGAFTSLLLGLGAVALLVGGVGIANVMVISVLERRSEIGLRRALGATRSHITAQFLTESLLLGAMGGIVGAALGAVVTAIYAFTQGQPVVVPALALGGGVGAALVIGVLAGLYPSVRAARLSPTEALRTV
ncbi:MAG: ABC transporter permease [Actinobacteria bacterium]|nr:ABC transporter permease [Actinomycetota bacterium]